MTSSTLSVECPCKIILFGEHAVLYGHQALAATIRLMTRVKMEFQPGINLVRVQLFGHVFQWTCEQIKECFGDIDIERLLPHYLAKNVDAIRERVCKLIGPDICSSAGSNGEDQSVKREQQSIEEDQIITALLAFFFAYRLIFNSRSGCCSSQRLEGMQVTIESEAPIGFGLGSSASFSVSLVTGFLYRKFQLDERSHIGFDSEGRPLPHTLEKICEWSRAVEDVFHGASSGLDTSTCARGHLLKFQRGRSEETLHLKASIKILLVNSDVKRSTRQMVSRVSDLYNSPRTKVATDHILKAIGSISESACDIIISRECDIDQLSTLVGLNHPLLAALDVSHERLDCIHRICKEKGFAAKLTGAGGGGFAYVLFSSSTEHSIIEDLVLALEKEGFSSQECSLGVDGVKVKVLS